MVNILFLEKPDSEVAKSTEYEIDDEDDEFIEALNDRPAKKKDTSSLNFDKFENIIDFFEKEVYYKVSCTKSTRPLVDVASGGDLTIHNMYSCAINSPQISFHIFSCYWSSPIISTLNLDDLTHSLQKKLFFIDDNPSINLDPNEVPCAICASSKTSSDNPILVCQGCRVAAHQKVLTT